MLQEKLELEQYQQYLKTCLQLIQQYSQIKISNNQYAAYQAQDEQLKQRIQVIFNELKQNIDKTEQMRNQEINLDKEDLNFIVVFENKIQEYKQVHTQRESLKDQNKEAIRLKQEQEQQLEQCDNQLKTIILKLVGRTPQLQQLSEEQIQRRIHHYLTVISKLDEQISKGETEIQDITKRRFDISKKADVLTKEMLNVKKLFEKNERSIVTESNELKEIKLMFNSLKLKSFETQLKLLADLCLIMIKLAGYCKEKDEIEIQKELETFISQLNQGGSNHINVSPQQHYNSFEQQLNKYKVEKQLLQEKKTLIREELAKYKQLRQEVNIGRQNIKKTIKKYKQQKDRINRRSQLFDLVVRK